MILWWKRVDGHVEEGVHGWLTASQQAAQVVAAFSHLQSMGVLEAPLRCVLMDTASCDNVWYLHAEPHLRWPILQACSLAVLFHDFKKVLTSPISIDMALAVDRRGDDRPIYIAVFCYRRASARG
jgi:hypothetical protein